MSVQITATTNRLACNASSRIGVLDDISGEQVQLFKGVPGLLQCALFNGPPASGTFVNDVTNITQVDLYVRAGGPNGAVLCHKILSAGSIIASTYAAWAAGTGQQFTFTLTAVNTNQTIPSDGTLQIYFNVVVTTDVEYVAAFGYGQLVDAGLTNLGPPVASPFIAVITDIDGVIQNPVLDFTNVSVIGLGAQADLTFVLPIKKVGTAVFITAASGMDDGFLRSTDWNLFNAKEPALGNPGTSGWVLSSTSAGVRSWIAMTGGGGGGTITLSGDVTGAGTNAIVTTVVNVADSALSANIPRLDASENVFTGTVVNDQGLIADTPTEGVVLRNEHPSTVLVPLQNAPLVVFSATGWDTIGLVSHKWEMNERFFTTSDGRGARLSWEFAQDDGTYVEKSYITSSGDIAGLGYITAGFSFLTTGGMVLSENGLSLNSATASYGNNNTTVPVKFNSSNTTATAWRFLTSAITSGNMIEGIVPNSGFVGSYLKLGKSSNGSTLTSTLFDFNASGNLIISGALSPGGITMAGGSITFNNGNIGNLGLGSDWIGFTADPANGATNYAFVSSLTQGTSFNTPNLIMDFRCKNGSVDPIFRIFASGGAFFGKIGSLVTPTANDFCLSNNLLVGGISSAAAGSNACICIANSSVIPSGNIAGGTIYVQSGALKYRGQIGSVTILAPS